jgi:uncharacterized protein YkwD
MPKRFYLYFVLFFIILFGWWRWSRYYYVLPPITLNFERYVSESIQESVNDVKINLEQVVTEVKTSIIAPGPLRTNYIEQVNGKLTIDGVVAETNRQRELEGFPPLKRSNLLDMAALNKAKDMLAKQYFNHQSPLGLGVGDIVTATGYKFLAVGENLALGNYADDKELVQAWMDSPGHRANILSDNFTEIGIGFVYGQYEEHTTWLAVQEFGRPTTACPEVSGELKSQIKDKEAMLDALALELDQKKVELDLAKPTSTTSPEKIEAYNQLVKIYNQRVNLYEAGAGELTSLVDSYNRQVKAFNVCIVK